LLAGFLLLVRHIHLHTPQSPYALTRLSHLGEEDLDALERELRRVIDAAEAAPAPVAQPPPEPQVPTKPVVAVVESEKKTQREKIREKPAIKGTFKRQCPLTTDISLLQLVVCTDGTHSSVVSDQTLRASKWTVKLAKLEDVCSKCELAITDETMIQIESGARYMASPQYQPVED
jgi:hypothetical protein